MRVAILVGVTLFCTTLSAQRGRGGRGSAEDAEPQLEHFTHKVVTFDAPSIDAETAEYAIYLPKGYEDEKNAQTSYPLAVWLHGMNGSYHRFHRNGGPQILDQLRKDDAIPELIFVAISADRRPVYLNGLRHGDYEDLIVKDLIVHLEKEYRVAKDRAKRAIMGVSIGGMGALRLAMKHPDMFGTVAAHSAVVLPASIDDAPERLRRRIERTVQRSGLSEVFGDPIDPKKWAGIAPSALAKSMELEQLKKLRIYFDAGTDDRYGLAPDNEAMSAILKERGIDHVFELVEGGEHAWGSGATQQQLPKSLKFVAASFRAQPKDAAEASLSDETACTIIEVDRQVVMTIRKTVAMQEIAKELGEMLPAVATYIEANGGTKTSMPFTRYHGFSAGKLDIECGMAVESEMDGTDEIRCHAIPAGKVATTWHIGNYTQLPQAHARLQKFLIDEELVADGGLWEVYQTDPGTEPDPAKWKTQLFQPIKD